MKSEAIDLSSVDLKADSNISSPSLLNTLSLFRHSSDGNCRIALNILIDYAIKQPRALPKILSLLVDRFGFKHTSYLQHFYVQYAVIDVLWSRVQENNNQIFSKLFFTVAEHYLHTHFHTTETKDRNSVQVINFDVPPTSDLLQLRQTIWDHILSLYQNQHLKDNIFHLLYSYVQFARGIKHSEILELDRTRVLPFVEAEFNDSSFRQCMMVQKFLDILEENKLTFDEKLRDRFKNNTLLLAELLMPDLITLHRQNLDYDEFTKLKQKRLEENFIGYGFTDYKHFFEQCLEIRRELDRGYDDYEFQEGVLVVLSLLADRDPDLYAKVLKYYLEIGEPLELHSIPLVRRLLEKFEAKLVYETLNQPEYPTRPKWLFSYYICLQAENIGMDHLENLLDLYQKAKLEELPHHLDFLINYRLVDEEIIVNVTRIILIRAKSDPNYAHAISMLFNPHTELNKLITELFASDLDLLKQAYFAVMNLGRHSDYSGHTFNQILNVDPDFLVEYIDYKYEGKDWLSRYDDSRDYSFLWLRKDSEALMTQAVNRIYEQEGGVIFSHSFLEAFFLKKSGQQSEDIRARQDVFLQQMIQHNHTDINFMEFIFGLIAQFSDERRFVFVAKFLDYNKNFEDFKKLRLEPGSWSWSGSAVPMLQRRIEYFESLLPMLNTVEFLQHKQYVEQRIEGLRKEIEYEKKSDFIGD